MTSADPWSIGDIGILDNNQLARWSKPLRPRTWIGSPSRKLQAASRKQQAASLTSQDSGIIKDVERINYYGINNQINK